MTKSATDVMQEIIYSALVDGLVALKDASRGVPNALLRDLNAVHPNTTFADLPKELQASINASVRTAFTRLLKEGYAVAPADAANRAAPPRREGPPPERRPRPPAGRGDRPGSGRDRPGQGRDRPAGGGREGAGANKPPRGPRGPGPRSGPRKPSS